MRKILINSILIILSFNYSCNNQKKLEKKINYEKVNRKDTITKTKQTFNDRKQIIIERFSNKEIWFYNYYNSGFNGGGILIKVNENLEVISAYFDYWTDYIDVENSFTYEVVESNVKFSENPFKTNNQFSLEYEIKVNKISFNSKKWCFLGQIKRNSKVKNLLKII